MLPWREAEYTMCSVSALGMCLVSVPFLHFPQVPPHCDQHTTPQQPRGARKPAFFPFLNSSASVAHLFDGHFRSLFCFSSCRLRVVELLSSGAQGGGWGEGLEFVPIEPVCLAQDPEALFWARNGSLIFPVALWSGGMVKPLSLAH